MPLATRTRLFSSRLLPLLAMLTGLMSSCQSSRPGFVFQPAPGRPVVAATPVLTAAPDSTTTAAAEAQNPTAPATPLVARAARKARRAAATHAATAVRTATAPILGQPKQLLRRAVLRRPHPAAEAGLGTTVFGILGLIALPIAALGLILSGGALGWIIVGGLAALAVLVAWLDPFGR